MLIRISKRSIRNYILYKMSCLFYTIFLVFQKVNVSLALVECIKTDDILNEKSINN